MKTKAFLLSFLIGISTPEIQAQNQSCANATRSEISANLDLRAVASIFGDSRNLQDFEHRLNDPKLKISNLDLNDDNQVDYLRVMESVENGTHVIILQSILDFDLFQDIATIEIEKNNYNQVNIQVVGNHFLFGKNCIYEPVFYTTPQIYTTFWMSNYRPYASTWRWNNYPSYYYAWNPFSVYRYRNNLNSCINTRNRYNQVEFRKNNLALNIYISNRTNDYEKRNPKFSFSNRHNDCSKRYELDTKRNNRSVEHENEIQKTTVTDRVVPTRENSTNRNKSQRTTSTRRSSSTRLIQDSGRNYISREGNRRI
jgi:hypothetical protein